MKKFLSLIALTLLITGCGNKNSSGSVFFFGDDDDIPPRVDGLPHEGGPNATTLTLTHENLITHGSAYGDNDAVEIEGSYWRYYQLTKSASAIQLRGLPSNPLSWFGNQTPFARHLKKVTISYKDGQFARPINVYTGSGLNVSDDPVLIGDNTKNELTFTLNYEESAEIRNFKIMHAANHTVYIGSVVLDFYG